MNLARDTGMDITHLVAPPALTRLLRLVKDLPACFESQAGDSPPTMTRLDPLQGPQDVDKAVCVAWQSYRMNLNGVQAGRCRGQLTRH